MQNQIRLRGVRGEAGENEWEESLRHTRFYLARSGQAQAVHYSWDSVAHRVMAYYERILYERHQMTVASTKRALALPATEAD